MLKINLFILSFALFGLIGCQPGGNKDSAVAINQTIFLNQISGWDVNFKSNSGQKLIIFQKAGNYVFTGTVVSFLFSDSLFIEDFKLSRLSSVSNKKIVEYILYINNQYAGIYNEKHRIYLKCSINSLRIIILKSGNELPINAWDENHYYTFIQDTSKKGITDIRVVLGLDSAFKKEIRLMKSTVMTDLYKDEKKTVNSEIGIKPFIISRKDRANSSFYQQFIGIDQDGFASFFQVKKVGKQNKTESELFFHGSFSLDPNVNLDTNIHLQVNELYTWLHSGVQKKSNFKDVAELREKTLYSTVFIEPVYLELPDNAMVNIKNIDSTFRVDIPYASENNVMAEKLYACNKCFLRYKVIKSLLEVKKVLNRNGFGIRILDCYRPLDIQKKLYNKFPVKGYVADTIGGSIHNRGTAVDLSLTDLYGNGMEMGSEYDEFSVRSHISYKLLPDTVFQCRQFLRKIMMENHFVPIRMEWWHFEFDEARKFKKLNDSFPCSVDW
jgi:D-alanyl-D-alanine dipeptidase